MAESALVTLRRLKAGLWEAGFHWQDGTGQKAHGQDSAFRFNYGSEA